MFYILVGDKVIQGSFNSIQKAHEYIRYYHISGAQVIDEDLLRGLQQEAQQSAPPRTQSIIRKPYAGRERNASIPVYRPAVAPNVTRNYQSIKPCFKPKKVRNFRGLIE